MQWWVWFLLGLLADMVIEGLLDLDLLSPEVAAATAALYAAKWVLGRYLQRAAPEGGAAESAAPFPLVASLRYRLEEWFSSSKSSKPVALLLASLALVVAGGVLHVGLEGKELGPAMWASWTWVADAGAHCDAEAGVGRVIALVISIGGMLVFALLVGIVADEISVKVDELKRGRSQVLEVGHTLILNWSDKMLPLLRELCIANESAGGKSIVILSELDKEYMNDTIEDAELDLRGSTIVCRQGSPTIPTDINRVSPKTARAIIILNEQQAFPPDDADARVLRVLITIVQSLANQPGEPHVVVELADIDNRQLVELVGQKRVEVIVSHDVIGRLMIQCSRQPALGLILAEVLSFDGVEVYFKAWPRLAGMPFADVAFCFEQAIPIGIKKRRLVRGRSQLFLNPPDNMLVEEGDEIIVVAEDDDSYTPKASSKPGVGDLPPYVPPKRVSEKLLFINWRRDMDDMITELDKQVPKGSVLYLLNDKPPDEQIELLQEGGLNVDTLKNLRIVPRKGNTCTRKILEALKLENFDSVLILAESHGGGGDVAASSQASDCRTLQTLLLVRDIQGARIKGSVPVIRPEDMILVSEILNSQTRELVARLNKSDYVMSNSIVSAAIAQIAESRSMNEVMREFLTDEGSEFYLRPIRKYAFPGEEVCFWDIMARARAHTEIALGYKLADDGKCLINPPNRTNRRQWHERDQILVLADD